MRVFDRPLTRPCPHRWCYLAHAAIIGAAALTLLRVVILAGPTLYLVWIAAVAVVSYLASRIIARRRMGPGAVVYFVEATGQRTRPMGSAPAARPQVRFGWARAAVSVDLVLLATATVFAYQVSIDGPGQVDASTPINWPELAAETAFAMALNGLMAGGWWAVHRQATRHRHPARSGALLDKLEPVRIARTPPRRG